MDGHLKNISALTNAFLIVLIIYTDFINSVGNWLIWFITLVKSGQTLHLRSCPISLHWDDLQKCIMFDSEPSLHAGVRIIPGRTLVNQKIWVSFVGPFRWPWVNYLTSLQHKQQVKCIDCIIIRQITCTPISELNICLFFFLPWLHTLTNGLLKAALLWAFSMTLLLRRQPWSCCL